MSGLLEFAWRQFLITLACGIFYLFFIYVWGRTTAWFREPRGRVLLAIPLALWISRIGASEFGWPDYSAQFFAFNVCAILAAVVLMMSIDSAYSDSIPGVPGVPHGDGLPGALLVLLLGGSLVAMCLSPATLEDARSHHIPGNTGHDIAMAAARQLHREILGRP